MKPETRCCAASLFALALAACGPGDHERMGELNRFFGSSAAGASGTRKPASSADSVAPVVATVPPRTTNAGARANASPTPSASMVGRAASAGASGMLAGGAPATTMAAGAAGEPVKPDAGMPVNMPEGGMSAPALMCPAGYRIAGADCVCDLTGSYALHATIPVTLAAMPPIEAVSGTMQVWSLLRLQHDTTGSVSLSMSICGQTTPDICASAQPPVLSSPEAYGQYVPVEAWDMASDSPAMAELTIPMPLPAATFASPTLAQLLGISLTDPLGAWPASYKDVQGTNAFDGSAVNGAEWLDPDGDTKVGVSIHVVGATGAVSNASSGPMHTYGSASSDCPRTNAQAPRSPYAYLPLPQGLGVKRIKSMYTAQRIAFELHGALESCDRASGMLTGKNGAALSFDALIGGCSMVSGSSEVDCTQAVIDAASANGGVSGLTLGTGSFTWTRMAANATCTDVRATQIQTNQGDGQ